MLYIISCFASIFLFENFHPKYIRTFGESTCTWKGYNYTNIFNNVFFIQ